MLINLKGNKHTRLLNQALELVKQKKSIEDELEAIKVQLLPILKEMADKTLKIEGKGSAVLRVTQKKNLNNEMLLELVKNNSELLQEFVTSLSAVKQGALEKYLGTPTFNTLVDSVQEVFGVVITAK